MMLCNTNKRGSHTPHSDGMVNPNFTLCSIMSTMLSTGIRETCGRADCRMVLVMSLGHRWRRSTSTKRAGRNSPNATPMDPSFPYKQTCWLLDECWKIANMTPTPSHQQRVGIGTGRDQSLRLSVWNRNSPHTEESVYGRISPHNMTDAGGGSIVVGPSSALMMLGWWKGRATPIEGGREHDERRSWQSEKNSAWFWWTFLPPAAFCSATKAARCSKGRRVCRLIACVYKGSEKRKILHMQPWTARGCFG